MIGSALVGLILFACSRAPSRQAAASSSTVADPGSVPPSSSSAGDVAEPSKGLARCRVTEGPDTIDDGHGRGGPDGRSALENLRVLADATTAIVTWERQSEYRMGDSWRAPAMTMRRKGEVASIVELPVMAYACATYGYVAPGSFAEPFVTWGVQNTRGFEIWKALPKTKGGPGGARLTSLADRTIRTKRQEIHAFAASGGVTVAVTTDGACDELCACADRPTTRGVWVRSLDAASPFAVDLARTNADAPPADAPAIAFGDHGGAVAYRAGGALHIVALDRAGRPIGTPARLDEGDVGAPALTLAGSDVVAGWTKRASKSEPYRLRVTRWAPGRPPEPRVLETAGSAFAPAIIADASRLVLAWMEGDASRVGAIHVARTSLAEPSVDASVVVSGGETNARDPELSGSIDAPVLVYSSFSKDLVGGVIRIARLACGDGS